MGVFDRPHVGNWAPNRKGVVRYTPDAVLFLNGDVSVVSSKSESTKQKKIDIQRFITQISVDSGVEAGSCSGSFTMSIPNDIGSSLFSDGHSVFTPGLEVHIYMRGYFPVEGMANTLDPSEVADLQKALGDEAMDLALRPYYHCFHGVTTTANIDYSGGFYSINMSCTGMLHFWQYHDISTNASLFGSRPTGSKLKMSLVGHNFTNMSPFSIIYSLYKDTAGAAGGVAFALSASSNQAKKFFGTGSSLFEMTQKYWEQRFQSKIYNLRMFGVNGEQLNSVQTAMIGRMSTKQLNTAAEINLRHEGNTQTEAADLFRGNEDVTLSRDVKDGTNYRYTSFNANNTQFMPKAGEKSGVAVSAAQLKAFVNDISQWGNVNLWESSYTSKLDIASAAATAVGYEFYQDVDGDLVFKPPLYNLNTANLEAYRITPSDLISITRASAEPTATYMTVKSSAFSNMTGVGLDGEWGIRGQYIDYPLVAKFGWRPGDMDAQFYSSARGAFWAAVARIDILNEAMESANITIPLRPELRPGYPVYVEHLDCFYYVKSMSHSFSYGGQCTTSLQCVAKREKFMAPGQNIKTQGDKANGIDGVNLDRLDLPNFPLVKDDPSKGEGAVKFIGFPNVVLAIDPAGISPFAWALGQDVLDLSIPQNVRNMVMLLCGRDSKHTMAQMKDPNSKEILIKESSSAPVDTAGAGFGTPLTFQKADAIFDDAGTSQSPTGDLWVRVPPPTAPGVTKTKKGSGSMVWEWKKITVSTIEAQVASYAKFMNDQKTAVGKGGTSASITGTDWQAAQKKYLDEYKAKILHKKIDASGKLVDIDAADYDSDGANIFDLLAATTWVLANQAHEPDKLDSAMILNLLGDKKSNFSNASTPGYYRYYSSAHPVRRHQSPSRYTFSMTGTGGANIKDSFDDMADASHGQFSSVSSIDKAPESIRGMDNLLKRYVTWDDTKQTQVGAFRVAKAGSTTEDLPTDQIYTLVFSELGIDLKSVTPSSGHSGGPVLPTKLAAKLGEGIAKRWKTLQGKVNPSEKMADWFSPIFQELDTFAIPGIGDWWTKSVYGVKPPTKYLSNAWDTGESGNSQYRYNPLTWDAQQYVVATSPRDLPYPTLDDDGKTQAAYPEKPVSMSKQPASDFFKFFYCTRKQNGACKCYKNRGSFASISAASRKTFDSKNVNITASVQGIYKIVARHVGIRIAYVLGEAGVAWTKAFPTTASRNTTEAKDAFMELNSFLKGICDTYKIDSKILANYSINPKGVYKTTGKFRRTTKMLSPVFPISDSGGYRHYGSYAYGRGLLVGTEGKGWEKLLSNDPLEALDDSVVDLFVRDLLQNGSTEIAQLSGFGATGAGYAQGTPGAGTDTMLKAVMALQSSNPAAWSRALRTLRVSSKDETTIQSTAEYIEKNNIKGDADTRKVLAAGLINYFERGDTPGSTTDPLNAAYNIVDIYPGGGLDPVAGDEILYDSMVRMLATEESKFLYVSAEGADGDLQSNVVKLVQQQVAESAIDHGIIQNALRGQIEKPRDAIDFANMFDNWGGDGNWGESAAGQAFQKLATAFSSTPDDPRLADLYDKLHETASSQHNRWMEVLDSDGDEWTNPAQAEEDLNEAIAEHMTEYEESKKDSWVNDESGWYSQTFKGDGPPEQEYTDQDGNVGTSTSEDDGEDEDDE